MRARFTTPTRLWAAMLALALCALPLAACSASAGGSQDTGAQSASSDTASAGEGSAASADGTGSSGSAGTTGSSDGASTGADSSEDATSSQQAIEAEASAASEAAASEAQRLYDEEKNAAPSAGATAAQAALVAILDKVAACDNATVQPYLEAASFDPAVAALTYEEFTQGFFDGFTYEVDSAHDIGDGSVEVDVYLSTRDAAEALDELGELYQTLASEGRTGDMASEASRAWGRTRVIEATEPTAVYMVQADDGTWQVKDSVQFGCTLLGGYDVRQESDN